MMSAAAAEEEVAVSPQGATEKAISRKLEVCLGLVVRATIIIA